LLVDCAIDMLWQALGGDGDLRVVAINGDQGVAGPGLPMSRTRMASMAGRASGRDDRGMDGGPLGPGQDKTGGARYAKAGSPVSHVGP
jgi:hypothetical protein